VNGNGKERKDKAKAMSKNTCTLQPRYRHLFVLS
jgi:hypothetical protein